VRKGTRAVGAAVAGAALCIAACTPAGPRPEPTADAIYSGGDIVTVNDAGPSAEGLAVKDGKILAVGARAEVERAHRGEGTRIVELGGKTLVPAFIDAHSHYFSSLTVASQVNVYAPPAGPGKDVPSIVAALAQFAAERKVPKGELNQAYGYDENVMPNGRLLNRDDLDAAFPDNPVLWGRYDRRLKIGGVKITIDGSPQGRTAFFTTPYLTGGPGGEKGWKGELAAPQAAIDAAVRRVYDLNVPLNLHCNGDGAIDSFLEAYEKARAGDFSRPWNVTTIHTQFLRKDQIPRFVEWKIRPSFYTLHTFYFAAAHAKNRGAEQAAYLSPMRDAIDAGLRPSNHTDFYVAPLDQVFMMWSAVNRVAREGGVLGEDQRITPVEALKAQTIWAAEQYGEQDRRGSLEPGKIADLVVLSANPLKVDPATIKDIRVLETYKEGETIYRRN
jgi:predicted amidohydrolase YtcJ